MQGLTLVLFIVSFVSLLVGYLCGHSHGIDKKKIVIPKLRRYTRFTYANNKKYFEHADNVSGPWEKIHYTDIDWKD